MSVFLHRVIPEARHYVSANLASCVKSSAAVQRFSQIATFPVKPTWDLSNPKNSTHIKLSYLNACSLQENASRGSSQPLAHWVKSGQTSEVPYWGSGRYLNVLAAHLQ